MSSAPPIIDVSPLAAEEPRGSNPHAGGSTAVDEVSRRIGAACERWGFFQVVGHGVPDDLLRRFETDMRRFFALPPEAKQSVGRSDENAWGYYDQELTKNTRDWKEVFDYGATLRPELADDHPDNRGLDGANLWPRDLPGFRDSMLAYLAACETLAFRLLRGMCAGLGLAPDTLECFFRQQHTSFVRLNHYPRCDDPAPADAPDVPSRGFLGVNRHSDAGALTILVQSDADGLQVRREGVWCGVDPVPGAFVINTGDMLQVWSNDRYQAPLHRVVASPSRERFSAPYFFNPAPETLCAPLEALLDEAHPARYTPIHWGEFRHQRSAGDYADLGEEIQIARFRVA
ncbi:MAG: isopenicillin N synthase family oxygenase [Proteobacteria bacterium]|nr:isopenicillin N synthase family oxygenase [Pseudomonadota bacterium]